MPSRPKVVFGVSTGWGIRNFLQSGIVAAVSRDADVRFVASPALKPYFDEIAAAEGFPEAGLLAGQEPLFWRLLRQARRAVFQGLHDISTARLRRVRSRNPLIRGLQALSWKVQRAVSSQGLLDVMDGVERRWLRFGPPPPASDTSLYINTSPFDPRDNAMQRAAWRAGIPTVAVIPSWDNPSSKGCILPDTDHVLVWGPQMRDEMLTYYPGLPADRLRITGVPQFDVYEQPWPPERRSRFLASLGIADDRKVILFATGSASLFGHEPFVARDIADAIDTGELGDRAHLLVRCHPADPVERYADLAPRANVTLMASSLNAQSSLAAWRPPAEELDILATVLQCSAAVVNTASTMTLDALAAGKIAVCVGYDDSGIDPPWHPLPLFFDYTHFAPVAASGAAPIARSRSELISLLRQAMDAPDGDAEVRKAVVARFCPRQPDGAVTAVAQAIVELAKARRPQ